MQAQERIPAKARQQLADLVTVGVSPASLDDGDGEHASERFDAIQSVAADFRELDLLGQVKRQLADVELFRQYAVDTDGKVRSPMFFAQSISLRDRLVGTAVHLVAGESVSVVPLAEPAIWVQKRTPATGNGLWAKAHSYSAEKQISL